MIHERKHPEMFYAYAFSGEANCNECKSKIKRVHDVFIFGGNIFHDSCSEKFEGREKIERLPYE